MTKATVTQLRPPAVKPTPYTVTMSHDNETPCITPPAKRLNDTARLQILSQAWRLIARVTKNP